MDSRLLWGHKNSTRSARCWESGQCRRVSKLTVRSISKATAANILRVMQEHPEGLTRSELRRLCGATEGIEQFGRRIRGVRELGWDYEARWVDKTERLYVLTGPRTVVRDKGVTEKLRAAAIHRASGRCQMCGLSVEEDGIKLQADHRIPRSWGGVSELENLWAVCESCNRGKRNFFASFDDEEMREILACTSVYERISHTLRMHFGQPVAADYLAFVANFNDYQEDWQKRLRELRYPIIGTRIQVMVRKEGKRRRAYYTMTQWAELAPDHARQIKEYEKSRRKQTLESR